MIIPVIKVDKSPRLVNAEELDELLRKNALLAFHRSDGWVRVGFDEIRDTYGRKESSWKDRKHNTNVRIINSSSVRLALN
ncbi:MAG: hypothetical protein HIU83_14970 [Proteobacteria bacterium]|nr:hypothetical protein [Pseudomonadota bacterium]